MKIYKSKELEWSGWVNFLFKSILLLLILFLITYLLRICISRIFDYLGSYPKEDGTWHVHDEGDGLWPFWLIPIIFAPIYYWICNNILLSELKNQIIIYRENKKYKSGYSNIRIVDYKIIESKITEGLVANFVLNFHLNNRYNRFISLQYKIDLRFTREAYLEFRWYSYNYSDENNPTKILNYSSEQINTLSPIKTISYRADGRPFHQFKNEPNIKEVIAIYHKLKQDLYLKRLNINSDFSNYLREFIDGINSNK